MRNALILLLLFCAACQPGETPPTPDAPRAAAKLLATVYLSPTPNNDQRLATQRAAPPVPTQAPPTNTPRPTAYIGVFIGEVQFDEGGESGVNPALFAPTAQPIQSTLLRCDIAPNAVFGSIWAQNTPAASRLGCPIQIMFGFNARGQVFERGVMYRREDTNEVWAIAPGGTGVGRFWYVAQPQNLATSGISAPPGLRVPEGGSGAVWIGVEGVRSALGFARTPERRSQMAVQLFESGALMLDAETGTVFALIVNGDVYGPF